MERRITEDNPTGQILWNHPNSTTTPDYGGNQPSKKACKFCTWIKQERQHNRHDPIVHHCDHMACFELGKFNPIEGKSERTRINDYDSPDMNMTGNCKHFSGKTQR